MARYTYNADLVEETLDYLNGAIKALDNTNEDIQKGINTIINARGAENIALESYLNEIIGIKEMVVESINGLAEQIKQKATVIEEYQSAPWYKKVFATIVMTALKVVEGLASFVENIGDGIISIVGFIGGLFNSEFQDCIAEFVKTDWVGDFAYQQYEEGNLAWINKYSAMSHESTAANVLKGIGVVSGYIIIGVATGGAGLGVSLGVSAGVALTAGIGSGTQAGLQEGKTFNSAFGQGVKEGAIAAGTTLVLGAALSKLGNVYKGLHVADDIANSADDALNVADDFINNLDDASRSLITEGGDDTIKVLGKVADKSGNGGYLVQNSNGVKSVVGVAKDGGTTVLKLTGESADEFINAVTKAGGTFDDFANATKNTALSTSVANSADEAASAATSATKTSPKAIQALKDLGNNFANSKAGQAIGKVAANHPYLTNATRVATGAVQPMLNTNASTSLRIAENTPISIGATLEQNIEDSITQNAPSIVSYEGSSGGTPSINTPSTSQSNTYSGYSGSNSYQTSQIEIPETNIPSIQTGTTENSQTQIEIPQTSGTSTDYNNEGVTSNTPTGNTSVNIPSGNNSSTTTSTTGTTTNNNLIKNDSDSVVDKIKDTFGIDNNNNNSSNQSPITNSIEKITSGLTGNSTGTKNSTSVTSSDVLESVTGSTGAIDSIVGRNRTTIPTSSSPILTTNNPKSSSIVPLGAGLGAASLAGLGAKTFLDKKQNKKDTEKIEDLEEWDEDAENLEIDYGNKTLENEEADYLTPADEYAYQNA